MPSMMFARRRQESVRSTDSLNGSEDHTSWLADDVCANCGAPARASHLFCSQQCKEEDAKSVNGGITSPSVASTSAPTLSKYSVASSKVAPPSVPSSNEAATQASKFRYACPPSPNILAKFNSNLTSPALIALEQSLPATTSDSRSSGKGTGSVTSSADSGIAVQQKSSNRRSSSRSTFSSASDILSTDRSSPSPRSGATRLDDEDDLSDLEPSDLFLPPSAHPAASILLNSSAREAKAIMSGSASVTPEGVRRSPISKATPSSSSTTTTTAQTSTYGTSAKKELRKTIDFARRPSSTNLPPPVLFTSPVLATTMMKSSATSSKEALHHQHQSGRRSQGSIRDVQATLTRQMQEAKSKGNRPDKRPLNHSAPYSSPAAVQTETDSSPDVPLIENPSSRKVQVQRKKSNGSSPSLASACSSAGVTLRAISPLDCTFSAMHNSACGRYGCNGFVGSNFSSSGGESRSRSERSGGFSRRSSFLRGHKHTHSAAAGLGSLATTTTSTKPQGSAVQSKLTMTPFSGNKGGRDEEAGEEEMIRKENEIERHEVVKTPPRGRSKARGRRSTSRRSPSPPRGVARRGRSEDLMTMTTSSISGASPPISPCSTRSNPILPLQTQELVGKDHSFQDDEEQNERRGRSPTERSVIRSGRQSTRPSATTTTTTTNTLPVDKKNEMREVVTESCEMAWPAYGHHQDEWTEETKKKLAKSVATAIVTGAKGYDDVDLDEL